MIRRLALIASIVSSTVSLTVLAGLIEEPQPRWSVEPDSRLARLHEDFGKLIARLDEFEFELKPAVTGEQRTLVHDGGKVVDDQGRFDLDGIEDWLAHHEAVLGLGPAKLMKARPNQGLDTIEPEDLYFSTAHHRQIATDPGQPETVRAAALRALTNLDVHSEIDEPMVNSMLALMRSTDDDDVRRDILWGLARRPYPQVQAAAVDMVLYSPNRKVREQAIRTLEFFASDPYVIHLLQRTRDSDPSPRVRRDATRDLERVR